MMVTRTGAPRRPWATRSPPKPAPTITTDGNFVTHVTKGLYHGFAHGASTGRLSARPGQRVAGPLPGLDAAVEVHQIAMAGPFEQRHRGCRSLSVRAVDHEGAIAGHPLDFFAQPAQRNRRDALDVAGRHLVGLAHVEGGGAVAERLPRFL